MQYPIRVILMDDDYYALKWNTALVMRDPRTTVIAESSAPSDLLDKLNGVLIADVLILDVEYWPSEPSIANMITEVKEKLPHASIICLSQYGYPKTVQAVIEGGADGFLVKNEIQMAIVPGIIKSLKCDFVYTPSIKEELRNNRKFNSMESHEIKRWIPNPRLSPQLLQCFWLRVFFGMSTSVTAKEMGITVETVKDYVKRAYGAIEEPWGDKNYLFGVDITKLSPQDKAFILFSLPPE